MLAIRSRQLPLPVLPSRIIPDRRRWIHQSVIQQRIFYPIFEPIPEKTPKPKVKPRARAFDRDAPTPLSHREEEEDNWEATPWNGMIPVVFFVIVAWGLTEKWFWTLPTANDGPFGPMRYAGNPEAMHWGNYRRDIQSRKGRRQYDMDGL